MPVYEVSDGERTLELEGDSPPTEQELEQIFAQLKPQQPDLSVGEKIQGGLETALQVGSSIVAEPVAGLAGIVGSILPGEQGQGARAVEATREALTFEPRSEAGQRVSQNLGEALAPVGEALADAQQTVGDAGFEAAGGDGKFAAAVGAGGQLVPEVLLGALPFVGNALRRSKNAVIQAKRASIGEKIANKVPEKETAKFALDAKGDVTKFKPAKEAINQGFDEGVIAAINVADDVDIEQMAKVLDRAQKGSENARFAATNRPSDVVGDSLQKRIVHVKRMNTRAGRELDGIAANLAGDVDVQPAMNTFVDDLRKLDIDIDAEGNLVFEGSQLDGLKGPQKTLKTVVNRVVNTTNPSPQAIHKLKRFIDAQVTFGKSQRGLQGQAEAAIKKLRRNLDQSLDAEFPEYKRVNDTYSETIQALDDFQSVAGQKMDLFGPNADKAIGTLSRRLLSNAQSRINLLDSIEEITGVANKYGGKFTDDLVTQVMFVDELGRRFGAAAKTSLQGDAEKAAGSLIRSGVRETLIDQAAKGVGKAFGKTDKDAYLAMRRLLAELKRRQRQNTPNSRVEPRVGPPTSD